MKIEHFFYGMIQGKITLIVSEGVNGILTEKNFQRLRELTIEDNKKYLWLPTEQLVALPHIENVEDEDGRTWVQNEILLIPIHNYIQLTNPFNHFNKYFMGILESFPESFGSIEVEECQINRESHGNECL